METQNERGRLPLKTEPIEYQTRNKLFGGRNTTRDNGVKAYPADSSGWMTDDRVLLRTVHCNKHVQPLYPISLFDKIDNLIIIIGGTPTIIFGFRRPNIIVVLEL